MSNKITDLEYRIELAKDVYESLNTALDARIEYTAVELVKRFHFGRLFNATRYIWKISKWECEAQLIFEELDKTMFPDEKEVLLSDFNEFLEHHREWIIEYFRFANVFPNEESQQMYDVLTYGGRV